MANNSILKLQVDDKQYEASLKNAQQGLKALQDALRNSGKSFADVDKQTEEYVRELGKMNTTAKTARGSIGEMSSAFVELSRIEKQLTDQERQSPVGKALTESLSQLRQRTIDAKNELQGLESQLKNVGDAKQLDGGGLFGGDGIKGMLQVFGGNIMTKAAEFVSNLGSEVLTVMNESAQLAMQAEGVQMAFARLGDGSILEGLREATHGTVSDLELMKAAVKFNDFKLPVEELGTMLAFAQQKAKDTGQSVDYMVDSIVTGLGRKSLLILDNLGLSAAEIKEKMKETGDMTKAVGEIIREQMKKAGDYVETVADRAKQANVDLENAMLDLGNAMRETFGYSGWSEMATGIKTELVGAITFTIETVGEAKRAFEELLNLKDRLFGSATGSVKKGLASTKGSQQPANGTYYETTDSSGTILGSGRWVNGRQVQTGYGEFVVTGNKTDKNKKTTKTGSSGTNAPTYQPGSLAEAEAELQKYTKQWKEAGDAVRDSLLPQLIAAEEHVRKMKEDMAWAKDLAMGKYSDQGDFTKGLSGAQGVRFNTTLDDMVSDGKDKAKSGSMILDDKAMAVVTKQIKEITKPVKDEKKSITEGFGMLGGGLSNITSGLQQLGVDIPEDLANVIGGIQSVCTILTGIATTVLAIEAIAGADALIPFANGGIVKAANGAIIGNSYSGDNLRGIGPGGQIYGLNAGEVILNKAAQGNLVSMLNGGWNDLNLTATIRGEHIRLAVNNNGKRTGRGEMVQTNRR